MIEELKIDPEDPYLAADGSREPHWKKDVTPYQQLYTLNFIISFPAYVLYNAIEKNNPTDYKFFGLLFIMFFPMSVLVVRIVTQRLRWRHKNLPWYSKIEPYSIDSFYSAKTQTITGAIMLVAIAIWTPMPVAESDSGIKYVIVCAIAVLGGFTLFKGVRRLAWRKAHPELVDNVIFQQPDDSSQTTTPS